jgi:hypothetical protein
MRLSLAGVVTAVAIAGLIAGGCSAASEDQSHLGAGSLPRVKSSLDQTAAVQPASPDTTVPAKTVACPPGKAPTTGQDLRTIDQRCAQLRQDGEIWQRSRKLAVQNRGEAGARMADLHTPWTKENTEFFVDQCGARQQKSREQAMSRIDPRQLTSVCG